ncbi:DUF3667 domain-containing protein [uncultured Dokdonia sp.]|uniref:DUF3667 domain-containing protein n=1 Tax=uncultured Dokdonia sp. TaxID=575653 RepID=UPI002621460C|nr:DUF3667 domain-containing protein [uncultured Dokdonia sp.]
MADKKSKKLPKKAKAQTPKKQKRELLVISESCKNCGTPLDLDQRFCSHCGAKRMHNRLNTRNLLEDFTERFLNIENVFLKTFIDLFTKPEDVINGYIGGLRKRYMSAFSYFAVALTIGSIYIFLFRNWFLDTENGLFNGFFTGLEAGAQSNGGDGVMELVNFIFDYNSFISFLYIPFFAVISKIVFWNYKEVNFIEHIVIYLYAYSQTQIITNVLFILAGWSAAGQIIVSLFVSTLPFFYTAYVLYRVFNLSVKSLVLKTGIFLLIIVPFSILLSAIIGTAMYTAGSFDPLIESVKKSHDARRAMRDSIKQDSLRLKSLTPQSLPIPVQKTQDSIE